MSKSELKEPKDKKTFTTKQVFLALLPWGIIFAGGLLLTGYMGGWVQRGLQQDQVTATATQLVQSISKPKGR